MSQDPDTSSDDFCSDYYDIYSVDPLVYKKLRLIYAVRISLGFLIVLYLIYQLLSIILYAKRKD